VIENKIVLFEKLFNKLFTWAGPRGLAQQEDISLTTGLALRCTVKSVQRKNLM